MKRIILIIALFYFWPVQAQSIGDIDYGMYDSVVRLDGNIYRIRRIPEGDFEILRRRHEEKCRSLIRTVTGLGNIQRALGSKYRVLFAEDQYGYERLYEISKGDQMVIYFPEDEGGEWTYYPEHKILGYYGGHESDQAVNLATGETAEKPVAVSPNRVFLLSGMHDGQDYMEYTISRWNSETNSYVRLVSVTEIFKQVKNSMERLGYPGYVFHTFWVGNKLYFTAGSGKYSSITVPWP